MINYGSISAELPANPPQMPVKSTRQRYDKRINNGQGQDKTNPRRKPFHHKHISRNYAAKLFSEFSVKEQFAQILACDDLRLRFQALCYLWDRLEGKPFVATNPADVKQQAGITQDQRLQVAIQQLVIAPSATKSRKRKQLDATQGQLPAGDPVAIEAAAKDGGLK